MQQYFNHHIFICNNQRPNGVKCCANYDTGAIIEYAKTQIKKLPQEFKNKTRINIAGCLGRCSQGPVLVVYPQGVWYSFAKPQDIDEIINAQIVNNQVCQKLILKK